MIGELLSQVQLHFEVFKIVGKLLERERYYEEALIWSMKFEVAT